MQFINEASSPGDIKKNSSIGSSPGGSLDDQRGDQVGTRSASVPSVVYQEDISVKNLPNKNRTESLTTKMRLLITSCDEEASSDENIIEKDTYRRKISDPGHPDPMHDRKDSSEKDSLEESEESDWFNSDLSTPEYPSRRNSYNSKRSSLDIHGETWMSNEPWPINMYSFGGSQLSANPYSFGARKLSGGSSYASSTSASRSSLLNVPHVDDSVFRNDSEGHFIGGVEMRPISTAFGPNRRKSTSSLHILQARYMGVQFTLQIIKL